MIFVGQAGIEIILDTKKDLSTATGAEIIAINPDGVRKVWTATKSGTTVNYTTVAADLDKCGLWKLQAKIYYSGSEPGFGNVVSYQVDLPL